MAAVDNYLHLFFSNYLAEENESPEKVVERAKAEIKNKAKNQIKQRAIGSEEVEKDFESLYNLTPDEMGNIPIEMDSKALEIMDSYDQNISKLISAIEKGETTIKEAKRLTDDALADINNMLNLGAQTGGLTGAAEEQLRIAMGQLKQARSMISTKGNGGKKGWAKKDEILDILRGTMQGYASGYMLEVALPYSFLVANSYGGQSILEAINSGKESSTIAMLNTGADNLGANISKRYENDPAFKEMVEKVTEALKSTEGQAKADALVSLQSANGQGTVSGTWSYAGFQVKSYKDISSVSLGDRAQKTLGELGITQFYDENFLVNVAGGLAPTFQNDEKKYSDLNKFWGHWKKGYYDTQKNIDLLWYSIQNSMKLLAIADGIAGKISDALAANVHYYVIREKATARGGSRGIRVIQVSKIFNKILDAIESNLNSAMGINWGTPSALMGQYQNRAKYWEISRRNFVPHKSGPNKEAGFIRSSNSYQAILDTILRTKVSISLNFSDFFNV